MIIHWTSWPLICSWLVAVFLNVSVERELRTHYPALYEQLGKPGLFSGIGPQARFVKMVWRIAEFPMLDLSFRRKVVALRYAQIAIGLSLLFAVVGHLKAFHLS